ncbi:MAG: acetolactate synthase small subunit [Phycisphaeraceae bacterium]|nr:acetolactate synthase small subunit [Phycisphaeraceae bacterium]
MSSASDHYDRHVLAALVANEPGVLAKVAGMFAARGFNIDSLVVGRTENAEFSRMTIVVNGDDNTLEQVRKQLGKVVEVVKVIDYCDVDSVERDLMLARVSTPSETRREVIELADLFRARVVDVGFDELTIELSGTEDKIASFIDLIQPYGILELARTGVIAMARSEKNTTPTGPRRRPRSGSADERNKPSGDVDPTTLPPG